MWKYADNISGTGLTTPNLPRYPWELFIPNSYFAPQYPWKLFILNSYFARRYRHQVPSSYFARAFPVNHRETLLSAVVNMKSVPVSAQYLYLLSPMSLLSIFTFYHPCTGQLTFVHGCIDRLVQANMIFSWGCRLGLTFFLVMFVWRASCFLFAWSFP